MKKTLAIAALASFAMGSDINDFHDNSLSVKKDLERALDLDIMKRTVGKLFGNYDDIEIENELHLLKELETEAKKVGKNPGLLTKTLEKLLGYDDLEFDNELRVVEDAKRVVNNPDIIKKIVGKLFGYDDIENEFNVVGDAKRVVNNPNIITKTVEKLFGYDDIENELNFVGDAKKIVHNPDLIKRTVGKLFGYDEIEIDNEFSAVGDAKRVVKNPDIIKKTVGKLFGFEDILAEDDVYFSLEALREKIKRGAEKYNKTQRIKGHIAFGDEDNELAVLRDLIHEAKQFKQENMKEKRHFRGFEHHHHEDLEIENDLFKIPPVKIKIY